MPTEVARAVLRLTSPVHVASGEGVLRLRRMGLAMLAYVALEGPTRRERLADVIWGHRQALHNLRVELHRLRAAFATIGMTPLQASVDPLVLAASLDVAPVEDASEFLVGLEDISSDYQAWVEHRRDLVERVSASSARDGLLDALAGSIQPPFVLVVQGMSGSGRRTLAKALAHRLRLPFVEGTGGDLGAVRYLPPPLHGTEGLASRIRHDRRSVWVVGRSAYGVDSRLLLELRAAVPPERWRFEVLRPLTWREAKRNFLDGVAFHEAAPLYLDSGGHPGYLRELVALRGAAPTTAPLPIPQRVRAALALEAAQLSDSGQVALERLSIFGSRFSPALATKVEADAGLDELERNGWLRFENDVWHFADPIVAKVLRAGVPAGLRDRLRRLTGSPSSGERAGGSVGARERVPGLASRRRDVPWTPGPQASARGGACPPAAILPWTRVVPGRPVFLDGPYRDGGDVEIDAASVVWSRLVSTNGPTGITWPLPEGRLVARLTGRVALAPDEAAGPTSDPTVLRLAVRGTDAPSVSLAVIDELRVAEDGHVWLPADDAFDHWFLLPHGARGLDLTCHAASIVLELEASVHRVEEQKPGVEVERVVVALDMSAVQTPAPLAPRRRARNPAIA